VQTAEESTTPENRPYQCYFMPAGDGLLWFNDEPGNKGEGGHPERQQLCKADFNGTAANLILVAGQEKATSTRKRHEDEADAETSLLKKILEEDEADAEATLDEKDEASAYTKTNGSCRGGQTWPSGSLWDCSGGRKTIQQCLDRCDQQNDCAAIDLDTDDPNAQAECCTFMAGNTGDGNEDRWCYVKEAPTLVARASTESHNGVQATSLLQQAASWFWR
jgi:hypothetical protein